MRKGKHEVSCSLHYLASYVAELTRGCRRQQE